MPRTLIRYLFSIFHTKIRNLNKC